MADLGAIAERLYAGVMAPMVLGGAIEPGHAIGARAALALGEGDRTTTDPDREFQVQLGRVRRARRLAAVDRFPPASRSEWALGAILHDLLQAANPTFDTVLRRSAAERILLVARDALDRVPDAATVREALSRHTWFGRVLDIARTDTSVSWWVGSRTYLGVEAPHRLQAWPELRRVSVVKAEHALLELEPLAVDRAGLTEALARFLAKTPLTALATCTRDAPPFVWSPATLALVATRPGRTLALRALAKLPAADVDAALGRATRDLLGARRSMAAPAVTLLGERALAQAAGHVDRGHGGAGPSPAHAHAAFARGLGAVAGMLMLESGEAGWPHGERARLIAALDVAARSPPAREAVALLGEGS
ncbi:MAG TPA: hypothetical protein VGG39_14890 [Polyangiaceae bacterium]|jgi:hypothetical protein